MKDGRPQWSDRRLFMQLLAFGGCPDAPALAATLDSARFRSTLYADLNDPRGAAILGIHEDPAFFTGPWRSLLSQPPWAVLTPKPEYTMFGRTYSIGYEPDLDETLIHRPLRTALNPAWPWAIWYPLRRSGRFAQLPAEEQRAILGEHGALGFSFGMADYGHDVRLASFGLNKDDNDFVIGLVGKDLTPLSKLVEAMRKTRQTSQYLERLGPFFVGRAVWQSPLG
jgi:hypothetical protein